MCLHAHIHAYVHRLHIDDRLHICFHTFNDMCMLVDHHMFSGGLQENLAHLLASIHLSVLQVTTNKHIQHPHVNNELYEYFVER